MIEKISGDLFCILPDFHYLCGSKTDDYAERSSLRTVRMNEHQ